jgi:ABC-type Na+ efflux pump permease subunit
MFGGGVWPVVQRELRETARRPFNHWLRAAGAGIGVVVFCFVSAMQAPASFVGIQLFNNIHLLLLFLICAIVPAITADSIARERREGTLGLLFMTPLTASAIVLGKILARVLRAFTLWLALLPLLAIPFIYGGITWANVEDIVLIELCAAMLCLAAGVVASCLTDHRAIAFIAAFLLMGAFMGLSGQYPNLSTLSPARMFARAFAVGRWGNQGSMLYYYGPGAISPGYIIPSSPGVMVSVVGKGGSRTIIRRAMGPAPARGRMFSLVLLKDFFYAAIILLASIRFAGWRVERSWQDKIPSVRQGNWVKRYCTPIFLDWFARRMQRALDRNPIAWLQQYSWKARLSKWGLCLLFTVLECRAIDASQPYEIERTLLALLLVLAAAYTYAGVNGFLQEKKTGALELILVSPITVRQLIFGRAWGLWKQFLPAALVLAGSYITIRAMLGYRTYQVIPFGTYYEVSWGDNWFWLNALELVAIYLMLPIIATYCALRFKNLFWAAACTWIVVLTPFIAAWILRMPVLNDAVTAFFAMVLGNGLLAVIILNRLDANLARRRYSY